MPVHMHVMTHTREVIREEVMSACNDGFCHWVCVLGEADTQRRFDLT